MAIPGIQKHVGILTNAGTRVVVVFRKIPNDTKHCLVVETDRLPDSFQDQVQQCLISKDALDTNDFFEVLNKRSLTDGSNCLTLLHQRGYLRKELITNVTMIPLPTQQVQLELINATIDKTVDAYTKSQDELAEVLAKEKAAFEEAADPVAVARGLVLQAEILENDAAIKRARAYELDPSQVPRSGTKPNTLSAEANVRQAQARRARDQEYAAKAKDKAKAKAIEAKVAKKLARDLDRPTPVEVVDTATT